MYIIVFLLEILINILFFYMFFKFLSVLLKKDILKDDDIFYITSFPWEYKKFKSKK